MNKPAELRNLFAGYAADVRGTPSDEKLAFMESVLRQTQTHLRKNPELVTPEVVQELVSIVRHTKDHGITVASIQTLAVAGEKAEDETLKAVQEGLRGLQGYLPESYDGALAHALERAARSEIGHSPERRELPEQRQPLRNPAFRPA